MTELSHAEKRNLPKPWLKVDSFAELMRHEKDIVARINRMPSGGQLFLIHPFMLLRDVGVELSKRAVEELQQYEPRLTRLSTIPYEALKNSQERQHVQFHLRGLFEKGEKS